MKTTTRRLQLAALVTTFIMIATVTPALADQNQQSNTGISEIADTLVTDLATPEVAEQPIRSNASDVGLRRAPVLVSVPNDPVLGAPIGDSPEWTVGLGRYIYIYLNPGDWNTIRTVGYGAAAGFICFMLTSTGVGAALCGAIAGVVYLVVLANTGPRAGYCAEVKFNYLGQYRGLKYLRRNC